MPVNAVTQETLNRLTGSGIIKYPDPFFDLSKNYVPENIKRLFKFCRNIFYTNSQLRNVINKMTQYPITEILYNPNISEKLANKYDEILNDNLHIKSFLISVGIDYYTYGNSIITTYIIPKRFLKCSKCGNEIPFSKIKNFKFKNFEFYGSCNSAECKGEVRKLKIVDSKIKSIKNFKLVRLNLENINIDYNPLTGESQYTYNIPNKIKRKIQLGDKHTLETIPPAFIEAVKNKKAVILDTNNIYHLRYPSLAEDDMGWAKPPILPALREIYYLQTLKRANEAIANEHIIPKKAIFPASNGTLDPFSKMNMRKWAGKIKEQLEQWKIDPNHIGIFPIPIGYQELGGNGKALSLTAEMKFIEENIINSLGVPLEFIKGGVSWSGSSVSLRIVENGFLNYREHLLDLVNFFIIPKISGYLNIEPVKVHFKKFKMGDDNQHKQLLINLFQIGGISKKTLIEEFGIDYHQDIKAVKEDNKVNLDNLVEQSKVQAITQGEAQITAAKYQGKAQDEMAAQEIKNKIELFGEELVKELGNPKDDLFEIIEKITLSIKNLPIQIQQQQLMALYQQQPITYSLVSERLGYYRLKDMQINAANNGMIAAAYGKEETKNSKINKDNEIKIREKEKTKGNTRGEVE